MDKSAEQRMQARAEVLLQPGSGGYMVSGYTRNIALNGCFVEIDEHFPVGTKVLVVIRHPENGQTAAVEGVVKYAGSDGMDVTYQCLSARSNEQLQKVLSAL